LNEYIRTLDEIDAESLALVGGKGANLGELRRAGLPVPPAFCLTTSAYRRHLEDHALFAPIREVAAVDR
jgi:pyruvate,water dikinase